MTWPGNGFLFNQRREAGHLVLQLRRGLHRRLQLGARPRPHARGARRRSRRVEAHSDLGPPFGGCYAGDMSIGTALDNGEIFDSSLPAGAPAGSYSHVDCFRERFAQQLADGTVPAFNYLTLTSDHTRGTQPGFPTPTRDGGRQRPGRSASWSRRSRTRRSGRRPPSSSSRTTRRTAPTTSTRTASRWPSSARTRRPVPVVAHAVRPGLGGPLDGAHPGHDAAEPERRTGDPDVRRLRSDARSTRRRCTAIVPSVDLLERNGPAAPGLRVVEPAGARQARPGLAGGSRRHPVALGARARTARRRRPARAPRARTSGSPPPRTEARRGLAHDADCARRD